MRGERRRASGISLVKGVDHDGKRNQDRNGPFIEFLKTRGVATGVHFLPAHKFTFYEDCRCGPLPVTEQVAEEICQLRWASISELYRSEVLDQKEILPPGVN